MADEDNSAFKTRKDVKFVFGQLYLIAAAAVEDAKQRQQTMAATMTPAELALEWQVNETKKWLDAAAKVGGAL